MKKLLLRVAPMLAVIGCESSVTSPNELQESALTILRFAPDGLPLATRVASVWAVKGRNAEIVIRYVAERPGEDGEEFLKFKIPGNGLLGRRMAECTRKAIRC